MPAASSRSQTHNPYVSPRAGGDARGEASSVDIFSAVSAFEVGDKEKHDVRVRWSLWSGEEVYMVDGEEVMRMRSFDFAGVRQLELGREEKHQVEIRFRTLPFNMVSVYVDGQRRIGNLFPRLSLLQWTIAAVFFIPLGVTVVWFVL